MSRVMFLLGNIVCCADVRQDECEEDYNRLLIRWCFMGFAKQKMI